VIGGRHRNIFTVIAKIEDDDIEIGQGRQQLADDQRACCPARFQREQDVCSVADEVTVDTAAGAFVYEYSGTMSRYAPANIRRPFK